MSSHSVQWKTHWKNSLRLLKVLGHKTLPKALDLQNENFPLHLSALLQNVNQSMASLRKSNLALSKQNEKEKDQLNQKTDSLEIDQLVEEKVALKVKLNALTSQYQKVSKAYSTLKESFKQLKAEYSAKEIEQQKLVQSFELKYHKIKRYAQQLISAQTEQQSYSDQILNSSPSNLKKLIPAYEQERTKYIEENALLTRQLTQLSEQVSNLLNMEFRLLSVKRSPKSASITTINELSKSDSIFQKMYNEHRLLSSHAQSLPLTVPQTKEEAIYANSMLETIISEYKRLIENIFQSSAPTFGEHNPNSNKNNLQTTPPSTKKFWLEESSPQGYSNWSTQKQFMAEQAQILESKAQELERRAQVGNTSYHTKIAQIKPPQTPHFPQDSKNTQSILHSGQKIARPNESMHFSLPGNTHKNPSSFSTPQMKKSPYSILSTTNQNQTLEFSPISSKSDDISDDISKGQSPSQEIKNVSSSNQHHQSHQPLLTPSAILSDSALSELNGNKVPSMLTFSSRSHINPSDHKSSVILSRKTSSPYSPRHISPLFKNQNPSSTFIEPEHGGPFPQVSMIVPPDGKPPNYLLDETKSPDYSLFTTPNKL